MTVICYFKFTMYAGNTIKHRMVHLGKKSLTRTDTFHLLKPKMFVISTLVEVASSWKVVVVVVNAVRLPVVVVQVRHREPLLQ